MSEKHEPAGPRPITPDDEPTRRERLNIHLFPSSGGSTDEGTSEPASPAQAEAAPAAGTVLASRYTVLEVLGEGGMGVVLAAYDARLDRRVAFKLLRPPLGFADETSGAPRVRMLRRSGR